MMKKALKFIGYGLVGLLGIGFLLFLVLYLSLNEKVPEGVSGSEADQLANHILKRINYDKYATTDNLAWTFRNKNHYVWHKSKGLVEVRWNDKFVRLNLENPANSEVFVNNSSLAEGEKNEHITYALQNFHNDSFWIVAPFKLFDKGTSRQLVVLEGGEKALLVNYSTGGTTPGDTYLWKTDNSYLPTSYKMWVSIIPIGGLEASWKDWNLKESGTFLAEQREIMGVTIPVSNIRAWNDVN